MPDDTREDPGLIHRPDAGEEHSRKEADSSAPGWRAPVQMAHVEPIRETVTVRSAPERAFDVFTNQMGTWWPVESYSRSVSEFEHQDVKVAELEFQVGVGGSILEHMSDGRILPWAEVIAWHRPHRVVLAWRPHSTPEPPTEVEVTFAEREGGTSVGLEHRGWERLSEQFREELYEIYARGWSTTLACFAAAAGRDIPQDSQDIA
jgi:uncharacterized protein YndB with AHSA1/START domain